MTDSTMPTTGRTATIAHEVSDADSAQTLGTGDVPVLASSRLLTWAEQATCAAIEADLDEASISVGTELQIEHHRPSPTVMCRLLKGRPKDGAILRAYDRCYVPIERWVESTVRPPFGQSVFAVGRV